jgi:hypothetical protein
MLLKETGLPLLSQRRKIQQSIFIYNYFQEKIPQYLHNVIPHTVGEQTGRNLRNRMNLVVPATNKNYILRSFIPSSIREWNSLPLDVCNAPSKEALKTTLLKRYGIQCNKAYLQSSSKGSINLSRIRMGLSALNGDRHKYHFIDYSL